MQAPNQKQPVILPAPYEFAALAEQYWPPRKMIGRVFMPDLDCIPDRPLRFFAYTFDFTLGSQATFQQTVTVGHRFYWWGITGDSLEALAFRVRIQDGRTRQPFQTGGINDPSYVGSAQMPFFMRRPHCIPYQRPINVQAENQAALTNHVQVVLLGAIFDG